MGRVIHSNQDQSLKQYIGVALHASKLFSKLYKLFSGTFQKSVLFAKAKKLSSIELFFIFFKDITLMKHLY